MKKSLLIAFLLVSAFSATAQVTFRPGIRAGANFSTITDTDLDTKIDFYIGAFGAIRLSRFYTMQPEITYSRQGAKGTISTYVNQYDYNTGYDTSYYASQNVDFELQYIALALINKFTLTDSFNVHLGPTFDIIANSPRYLNADVDLGITAGAGYTTPFGLSIEARVKKGFVDILDSYYYGNNYSYDSYDSPTSLVFSVGVSYSFKVTGSTK